MESIGPRVSASPPSPPFSPSSSTPSSLPPILKPHTVPGRSPSLTSGNKTGSSHVTHSQLSSAVKAATRHSHAYHSTQPHSATSHGIAGTVNTQSGGGSAVDSRLTSIDGIRRGSACFNFPLHDEGDNDRGCPSSTSCALANEHIAVEELPSAPPAPSPIPHHGSWHVPDCGGLSLSGYTTQRNMSTPPGHVHESMRDTSMPATPLPIRLSSPTTPPASPSLFSLRDHATANGIFTFPPQPGAVSTTQSRATTLGVPAADAAAEASSNKTKKAPRKRYRLGSAQARRVVLSQQRHRKLFELNRSSEDGKKCVGKGPVLCRGTQSDQERRGYDMGSDTNVGCIASLSSPTYTLIQRDHMETEMPSTYSAPGRSVASSAPFSSSAGGVHPTSSSEAGRCSSTNATVPPAPNSSGCSSVNALYKSTRSSFKTIASLTSLQHRLWQHTTASVTAAAAKSATDKNNGSAARGGGGGGELGNAAKHHPLSPPPSLPPARPPPLPGLPLRTAAAATISQGRQGQYAKMIPVFETNSISKNSNSQRNTTAAGHGALTSAIVPVMQWKVSLMDERMRGRQGMRVAQWLVWQLLATPPSMDLDRSRYNSFRGAAAVSGDSARENFDLVQNESMEDEEDEARGGGGLLRSLSERAAVAAYLLSTLTEDGLPRHQLSIVPYVRMLIEFAFVADTPPICTALGNGTVQDEELLDRLAQYERCSIPLPHKFNMTTNASAAENAAAMTTTLPMSSTAPHHPPPVVIDDEEDNEEEAITVDLIDLLAPSFTRKTYITAHFELSGITVGLAHEVRCRGLHQRNVPRLLERTHKNWMRGLMRAVLRAWRRLCQERRVREQRQRARWALRWTSERTRIAIRRWRGYAALTLQTAEADSVAKAALSQKMALIERLETEAAAMQRSSQELQETLQQQDEQREVVETKIAEQEILYQRLLRQVREVDRVGSLMLNSLLLESAPPRFDDASAIAALASAPAQRRLSLPSATFAVTPRGSTAGSADALTSEEEEEKDELSQPSHAVTAIPTLLQWAKDCCTAAEEEFFSVYPRAAELNDTADEEEQEKPEKRKDESTKDSERVSNGQKGTKADATPTPQRKPNPEDETPSEALPIHPPLDFDTLLLNTSSLMNLSDASVGETVLLPLHKLLLLMRGCSGLEGDEDVTDNAGSAAGPVEPADEKADLLAAADVVNVKNGAGVAAAVAPSLGMIRTVQEADARVLKEAYSLIDEDNGALRNGCPTTSPGTKDAPLGGEGKGADSQSSGLPLLLRLSAEKRDTLQRVCRVVIDAYEQLTGTACIVTVEQLIERSRGTLLVFLAALMRHYTNWMVRRTQQALPTTSAPAPASTDSANATPSTNAATLTTTEKRKKGVHKTDSEGTAHQRYDEWSHPPHSHRRWRGQVRRQAEWIGLSFSALHDALRVATMPSRVLTVGQQAHVSGLLEKLSLTEFIDLLPNSPDQTTQCYVSMVRVVERYAPSLHLLFHQFALPLAQLRADGGAGATTTAKPKRRQSTRNSFASNPNPETDLYVTANTVWRLLCMTGLAGERREEYCTTASRKLSNEGDNGNNRKQVPLVTPPLSATLHRPAVFSLIEQVTQSGVSSTTVTLRHSSMRQQPGAALSPRKSSGAGAGDGLLERRRALEDLGTGSTTSPLVQTVSCKTLPRTCYARALREGRHVDLRPDTGAVCVNYTQFVKVLMRLAHAWQCQQQQLEEAEQDALLQEKKEEGVESEAAAGENVDAAMNGRSCRSSVAIPITTLDPKNGAAGAASSRQSFSSVQPRTASLPEVSRTSRPSSSSTTAVPSSSQASSASATITLSPRVEYEAGNYARTLSLPYFHTFFGELLLPRLLGANRWTGAAQRAMCSRPVLQLLAQHHDRLVDVFNDYQRPREARGVRAALPPPYSTVLASQLFSRVVDAERQVSSGLTMGGGRSMSHVQRASLMYSLNSSMNRRGSSMALFDVDDYDEATVGGGVNQAVKGDRRTLSQRRRSSFAKSKRVSVANSHATLETNTLNDNLRSSIVAVQQRDISIVSVLQWKDVLTLAKDMRWFSIRRLTERTLRECFEHVRVDTVREGDALFFTEFLQLLCSLSFFATTNPAVPLEVKLNSFLESYVLSTQN